MRINYEIKLNHIESEIISVETIISNEQIEVSRGNYSADKDKKYLDFLKRHKFDSTPRVYDLYLRLCGASLL